MSEQEQVETETLALEEEDRLPWLEAVDASEDEAAVSPGRLIGLVLGGLGALALLVGAIWWLQDRNSAPGEGELIAAADGDYKVAPTEAGAKQFQGEGDASYKTSQGGEVAGKIDLSKAPETPANAKASAPGVAAAPAVKGKAGTETPPPALPAAASAAAPVAGGAMVQLGAFNSEAVANKAWGDMAKRFKFLSGAKHSVTAASVGGGTVYRLRASVANTAQASDICTKMAAVGQNCMVVR